MNGARTGLLHPMVATPLCVGSAVLTALVHQMQGKPSIRQLHNVCLRPRQESRYSNKGCWTDARRYHLHTHWWFSCCIAC